MKTKFTFKTNKPTGKWRTFSSPYTEIKVKGKKVGSIGDYTWTIRFMVIKSDINEDGNPNCKWKWITLKQKSDSLQEAKDWLNHAADIIVSKYNLYYSA